jgi:hypothetical protein
VLWGGSRAAFTATLSEKHLHEFILVTYRHGLNPTDDPMLQGKFSSSQFFSEPSLNFLNGLPNPFRNDIGRFNVRDPATSLARYVL